MARETFNTRKNRYEPKIESQTDFRHINVTKVSQHDWNNIPARPWLMGDQFLRGEVTVTSGPGGVGKTALSYTVALSLASGKNLLDPTNTNPKWKLHHGPLKVYLYSLEDNIWEMMRRLKAVMNFHGLRPEQFEDTLRMGDGTSARFVLATMDENGNMLTPPCVQEMMSYMIDERIDLLVLDPLVKAHTLEENSNGEMDSVMTLAKELAIKGNCAIQVIHHSGKAGIEYDATGSRGASSIISAARIGEVLTAPTKEECERFGFGPDIVKLNTAAKVNLSAKSPADIQWLRLRGQAVGNGDFAQVIELASAVKLTDQIDVHLFDTIIDSIRVPPINGKTSGWVSDRRHENWVGNAMAAGGVASGDHAATILKDWMDKGIIVPDPEATSQIGGQKPRTSSIKTGVKLDEEKTSEYRQKRYGT